MGGYARPTDAEREQSAHGRFEIICERYIEGPDQVRQVILAALNPEDRQTFLIGCGLYHLFTDQRLYDATKKAMGMQLYEELHGKEQK